ncbi:hypothetical protein L6452_33737 [Arctium lappa]|uniref:Uncharacterized protein n=1 Tax=Arctium lappa TaxID=4217 RepID=A0ACB8YH82_ARCLA|nr:hypothetical protein L6452_33737 [Arctium lappa]
MLFGFHCDLSLALYTIIGAFFPQYFLSLFNRRIYAPAVVFRHRPPPFPYRRRSVTHTSIFFSSRCMTSQNQILFDF